jgi:hypothetical protein
MHRDVKTPFLWGSHMACLVTAVINTTGPVLELGTGDFSTTILHALCKAQNRALWSVDTDEAWMTYFLDLENDLHVFHHTHDTVDFTKNNGTYWGVVFIDQHPKAQRNPSFLNLLDRADVFVLHDSQNAALSDDFKKVFHTFKYQYTDIRYTVETTVVSNVVDVREWFK